MPVSCRSLNCGPLRAPHCCEQRYCRKEVRKTWHTAPRNSSLSERHRVSFSLGLWLRARSPAVETNPSTSTTTKEATGKSACLPILFRTGWASVRRYQMAIEVHASAASHGALRVLLYLCEEGGPAASVASRGSRERISAGRLGLS